MFRSTLLATIALLLLAGSPQRSAAAPPGMRGGLVEGIMSYQVFPRQGDMGTISFVATRPGSVTADVIRDSDKLTVANFFGTVTSPTTETLSIERVPVGGEYTVRVAQGGQMEIFEHILVGEIWVVGGQSNAYGAPGIADPPIREVHMLRGRWQEASDPLFGTFFASQMPPDQTLVTPWVFAAQDYFRRTGVPVGLIGYAAPAKDIDFFLDPKHVDLAADFRSMVEQQGRGASLFCWYQGESDALPERTALYKDRLKAMAAALRRTSRNPNMTMLIVQLSYQIPFLTPPTPAFGRIRGSQREFCIEDPRAVLIPALPYEHRDGIHLSAKGVRNLAGRMAQALDEMNKAQRPVWQGPRLAAVRFTDDTRRRVQMKFDSATRIVLTSDPGERGDPMERWKAQWFITDDGHQGFAGAQLPQIQNGELTLRITGATAQSAQIDRDGQTLRVRLANTGYIKPMEVSVDGLILTLQTTEAALPGAKVSFALMDNSLGYLTDERGKPAAAFADVPISEP